MNSYALKIPYNAGHVLLCYQTVGLEGMLCAMYTTPLQNNNGNLCVWSWTVQS